MNALLAIAATLGMCEQPCEHEHCAKCRILIAKIARVLGGEA